MRVAVTGTRGRLGRALVRALEEAPFTGPKGPIAWSRPDLDLDTLTPEAATALIERDGPEVVVHAAAWTDVDGCAREPALAMRRNAKAAGHLADACVARGVDLVLISTNEVFDGRRTDGLGYRPDDPPCPINPYGVSKAEAERLAFAALAASSGATGRAAPGAARLAIIRTAWLHGPPGNDFPAKIAAAASRARSAGEPLRVVGDEVGSPTYAPDLAEAICELLAEDALVAGDAQTAIHHLVNTGRATRVAWAREVLRATRIDVDIVEVPADTWVRASVPPRWGVLEPTPLPSGIPMRDWREAFADAVPELLRALGRG